MSKPWQVWLVLVAIFAVGGVSGGLVGYRMAGAGHRHPLPPPRDWVLRRVARIDRELKLTPEQRTHIQPIVQRNIDELTKAWRQSILGSREIVERMEREIAAELTPEQRTRMEQYRQERRERFRKALRERGLRGDRDLPPDPPAEVGPLVPPPPPPEGPAAQPAGT